MSKKVSTTQYTISEQKLKSIIRETVNVTVRTYVSEQEKAESKRAVDRKYNTRILLENYYRLNQYADSAIYTVDEIMQDDAITEEEVKIMMKCGFRNEDVILHSIAEGALTVKALMIQVNRMLDLYEYECENSSSTTKQRQFRVLYWLYIAKDRLTTKEVAELENQEVRTIQNDAKQAREDLSVLLFGINGLVGEILN